MTDRPTLPSSANVVIVGGGIVGCSVAYHLAELGCTDVVLIERKKLTSGTTWHAAGLLTTLRSNESQSRLALYTQQLYSTLEEKTGFATGFRRVGSIQLACSPERVVEMRRGVDAAGCFGVEGYEISPRDVLDHWPLADVSDVNAAFYFPNDGRTDPADTTQALARGASKAGVRIYQDVRVANIATVDGRVTGVETDHGAIRTDAVVNCAGMWARELGLISDVDIPLQAAEHYYLVTDDFDGMHGQLPILRDPDNLAYYREEIGKLLLGLFEPEGAPWAVDGIPEGFEFDELPPDWERMTPYIELAMRRIPSMRNVGVRMLFCGPESFTPDHNPIIGEAPELKNYFVAAGFNSLGILSAGGAGLVLAHWIVNGHPPMDVFETNIRRTLPFQNNSLFLRDRIVETLGIGYQNQWPHRQWETARGLRRSALHDRLGEAGACFGESAGWERANWFAPGQKSPAYEYSFGRQNWFPYHAEEHHAVREAVGLFDQSSFSKFLVQGPDAEGQLNRVCTANVAAPVGTVIYTQWLNDRGTIEADLTVTRLADDSYMIVTAAFTHTHVLSWLKRNLSPDANVFVTDVTSAYAMLNIQGPRSRELLSQLADGDLDSESFPFATSKELDLGYARVRLLRLSYVGELGWEIYIPTELVQYVYDEIVAAGIEFGLRHCGYHALNSLRLEKAYREFGHDIGDEDSPLEVGLAFTCDFEKAGDFIGKDAVLAKQNESPYQRRLVQFLLKDPDPILYRNEPIYCGGERVGYTTSGMFGFTLGGSVALGYVNCPGGVTNGYVESGDFEISVAGERFAAHASLRPMYDPQNERARS